MAYRLLCICQCLPFQSHHIILPLHTSHFNHIQGLRMYFSKYSNVPSDLGDLAQAGRVSYPSFRITLCPEHWLAPCVQILTSAMVTGGKFHATPVLALISKYGM